jgi:hypothetical protein
MVIGGAVTLGTCYLFSLLAASVIAEQNSTYGSHSGSDSKALPLFIPALGPFIGIATLDPGPVGTAWLILDGLTQTAGAAMIVTGLASPTKRYLRNDIVAFDWKVTPLATGSHRGLGVVGRF